MFGITLAVWSWSGLILAFFLPLFLHLCLVSLRESGRLEFLFA